MHILSIIEDPFRYLPTNGGRCGRDRMVVGFTSVPMQSVPITTDVVSSNLDQGEVYNIM